MIKTVIGTDHLWLQMRRDTVDNHIPTKDDIIQPNRDMAWTMSGQVDHLKWTYTHLRCFISKINWNRLIKGFCKTVDTEELITRLFSETCFGQERSEATTDKSYTCFMMRYCLHI